MTNNDFWGKDWLEMQRKYWESLTSAGQMPDAFSALGNPWEASLDQWWKGVSPDVPQTAQAFMEKMMDQGKLLFRLAGDYNGNLQDSASTDDWQKALTEALEKLQSSFAFPDLTTGDSIAPLMDMWQQWVSSVVPFSMDQFSSGVPGQLFSMPGLGITRESQERRQDLVKAFHEYQQAYQAYSAFFSDLGTQAVGQMRVQLDALNESGGKVESARALYNQWVAACEKVYADQVITPEYGRLNGDLVNSVMRLRQQITTQQDEMLEALNMPTRKELNAIQQRAQADRRELRALKFELAALRERLEGGASDRPVAAAKPVVKKKSARKKVVKKKATKKVAKKRVAKKARTS